MKKPFTILLAEDDADDCEIFMLFLKKRTDIGAVITATNGLDLFEKIKQGDKLPDLIILDQNMPKLNGLETLRQLKGSAEYTGIPVMIYSTYANDLLAEESINAGAAFVASKPNDAAGYNKMIDDFIGKAF